MPTIVDRVPNIEVLIAGIFVLALTIAVLILAAHVTRLKAKLIENQQGFDETITMIQHLAEERSSRQKVTQRSVHVGHAAELFAPLLPDFPVLPTECRFFGSPVDFIGFKNLEEGGEVTVYFVEVKSGRYAHLNDRQRRIRSAVDSGRVRWVTYQVPLDSMTVEMEVEEARANFTVELPIERPDSETEGD
jgi:predicted Holliday junction resolvase-like endonuclease